MNRASIHRFPLPLAAGCLLLIAVWISIALQLHHLRSEAINAARRHGDSIAAVAGEHLLLLTDSIDRTLKHVRAQWLADPRRFPDRVGQSVALPDRMLNQVAVADARGRLLYPPAGAADISIRDRDYFAAAREQKSDSVVIGRPLKGRVSGKVGIPFAVAIRESGRFQGVVIASIAADELVRAYDDIDLGPGGFITFRHTDGTVMMRSRDLQNLLGGPRPDWQYVNDFRESSGSYLRRSSRDGVERVYSYRRLPGYPLIVVVGQDVRGTLARYYEQLRAHLAAGALVSLILMLLVWMTLSRLKRVEKAEKDLRESETRYRTLTGLSADWYWELDADYRFVALTPNTPSARAITQEGKHLGKRPWEMAYADAGAADWRHYRTLLEGGESFRDVVLKASGHSGRVVYMNVRGHPVYDGTGAFRGYRGITKDVTQKKRAERLLELEHVVNRCLAAAQDIGTALKTVMQAIGEAENWQCGRYWRVDKGTQTLRFDLGWGVESAAIQQFLKESASLTFPPGVGLAGTVWQTGDPLWVADITKDARVTFLVARPFNMHGTFLFPVTAGGEVIGVCAFASYEVREPDGRLLEAMRVIGSQIGEFVQRKQAEEVLRRSEERFRSLTQLSYDVYWEQDDQYRFTAFSENGPDWMKTANLIGKRRWDQKYLNMDTAAWAAHVAELEARRPFRDLELCRLNPRGERIWISVSGEPIFDDSGAFRGYRGVGKDITERKREERLRALEHAVNRDLADADDVHECMTAVIRTVCESEAWDCGRYFAVDEEAGVLRFADAWGVADPAIQRFIEAARDLSYRPGEGLSGSAWSSGQPLWSSDVKKDARSLTAQGKRGVASVIGIHGAFVFPVMADGKTIGILNFSSREPRDPEERLLQAIGVVGRQIGQFVRRKQAEQARQREDHLSRLEHAVTLGLAEAENVHDGLRAAIREICESQGWEIGRYFRPDDKAGVLRFVEAWSRQDPALDEFLSASRNATFAPGVGLVGTVWQAGQPLWVPDLNKDSRAYLRSATVRTGIRGAFLFPAIVGGKAIGVLSFSSREVREPDGRLLKAVRVIGSQVGQFLRRKQSEEELQRFRAAMDASADMVWLIDPVAMRIVDVNDTACRTLGYSREEVLAMGPHDIICAPRDELAEIYCRLVAGDKKEMAVSGSYRRKDGTLVPMESMRRAVPSGDGYVIIAAARDITERLAREEELRRFRLAMDNSADMIVLIDRATMRFLDVNGTVCRLLGYSRDELMNMGPQDLLPVSRDELERSYDELITNPSRASGMNTFYRCKDGTQLPFESTRRVLRSGDRIIIAAISRDISERLAVEEALRRSNERFNLAVRATNDVIWDWDLATDEHWWNENLKRVFGYAPETHRAGDLWKRSIHPEDRDRIVNGIRDLIESSGENWSDEYRFLRSDGTYARVLDRGHVVRDPAGKALRMIGAMTDITMRKEAEEKLAYLAQFDSLTGLPNRHLFRDRLMQSMARAKRTGNAMAVLFIDLDRFKLINDTLGHGAGDRLLKEATRRLQSCVRSSDTVGRFGGDEFGAIIPDLTKPADASVVARKIIDALARPFDLDGHESYVTASIGITLFPTDGEDAGTLIMNADAAMYRAKEQGRNTYQYFTREMNERATQRVKMETALRRAIERREFLLHYQPKVRIASGDVCGFEALMRWQHPERGLVPPLEFIPVLEDTGLIVPVGEWVITEVCAQIRRWQDAGFRVPPIAVNLSARQFQQKGLEASVARALRRARIDPALLQFELTESLLMKEPEIAARTLRGLKELGVMLSVDDFGTGYSSLSYLKRFPIDALKIDRAFIRDVTVDPDDAAITFAIIGLAHSLKLSVIAEGVETRDQLRFLEQHGCDEMQGFLFSRPVGADECELILREKRRLGGSRRRPSASAAGERRPRAQAGRS